MGKRERYGLWAYAPLAVLVLLLVFVIRVFSTESLEGGSQIALLCASFVCCGISHWKRSTSWDTFEFQIQRNYGSIASAIMILLLIGALSGIWMLSGIVPAFIYYGLKFIHPQMFLLCTCIVCAIVSVVTGSSWTTIATVGIAFVGIGKAQGFGEGWIAGAIISGAYFGDKVSPMSDTTVLSSSLSGVDLFDHIRYMMITTVPSMLISLAIFGIAGYSHKMVSSDMIDIYEQALAAKFSFTPFVFLVPLLTGIMIYRKYSSIVVMALSTLMGALLAILAQPHILAEVSGGSDVESLLIGIFKGLYTSTSVEAGNADINSLLATRGMAGMLNTVWLILAAIFFGSCMRASGMLDEITQSILRLARKRWSMVLSTVSSGVILNGIVADQYLSIMLVSNMFKETYEKNGYEGRLLSRSIEDSCTATSVLVPWSTCGMTQSTVLSIPTAVYFPYCIFNLLSPLMSVAVAAVGYRIYRKIPQKENA